MALNVEIQDQTPARAGRGWLVWLAWALLALLLAVGFWLLLGACGIRMVHGVPLLTFCPAPRALPQIAPDLAAEIARERALEAEIRRLELAMSDAPVCPPVASEAAPEPIPEPIPEDAWNRRDVSFLEGCWALETDYEVKNVETGAVRKAESWQVCFDAAGQGSQTLTLDDGTRCTAPMRGEFGPEGNLLLTDAGNPQCDDGGFVYERHMTCERTDAEHAQCQSVSPELNWPPVDVGFHRAAPG